MVMGICLPLPRKYYKVLFVLQMLSKVSVDKVFMRYFKKMLSASRALLPDLHRGSAPGARFSKNLRKNPKFCVSFS